MNTLKHLKLNSILFLLISIWCIGIIWNLLSYYFPSLLVLKPLLHHNYSLVCHTESNKLYEFFGFTTLTCSRCTGLYFGAFISSLLLLIGFERSISTKLLFILSLPMFVDVLLYSIGIYTYSQNVALLTGLFLGFGGFIYIRNSISEIMTKKEKN